MKEVKMKKSRDFKETKEDERKGWEKRREMKLD